MTHFPNSREKRKEHIFQACNNALENGYNSVAEWTAEELARDLQYYDYVAENMNEKELLEVVREWQDGRLQKRTDQRDGSQSEQSA